MLAEASMAEVPPSALFGFGLLSWLLFSGKQTQKNADARTVMMIMCIYCREHQLLYVQFIYTDLDKAY